MKPEETIEQFEIEENRGTTKSAHTKNPTTCVDVRRSGEGCGICGSFNVVNQGVRYCESCGLEIELLGEYSYYGWSRDYLPPICECTEDYYTGGRLYKVSPRGDYSIGKCLDCGAVNSNKLCPNCGSRRGWGRGAWKHWDGRVKCNSCGFTITNAVFCSIGAKPNKAEGKLGTRKAKNESKKYMSKRQKKRFEARNRVHPNKVIR